MTIGEKIKKYRKERGLTQKKLAEKAGIAEITIRQYETEKRQPRVDILQKIANALNIDVTTLLEFETEVNSEKTYQLVEVHRVEDRFYVSSCLTIESVKKDNKNLKANNMEDLICEINDIDSEYICFYRRV